MNTKLMVGTPAYGMAVTVPYFASVVKLVWKCHQVNLPVDIRTIGSESLITRARNFLVQSFLKSDATHLLFIDADIGFNPDDVIKMINADKDVVSGIYPKKTIDWGAVGLAVLERREPQSGAGEMCVNFLSDRVGVDASGCIEVMDAPTGFMLIQRHVLIRLIEAHPETRYFSDSHDSHGEALHAIFDCFIDKGRYLSEDYAFCRRWQALGGKVYAHVPTVLTHTGSYTFQGNLGSILHEEIVEAKDWPREPDCPSKKSHLERYEWAARHVTGKRIANAACGFNYGSPMLGGAVGFDHNAEQVKLAKERYGGEVVCTDIEGVDFAGFDALVSLETLEHLTRPWEWLRRLAPSVKELVLSVPIIPTVHRNPWHKHDFTTGQILTGLECLGWTVRDQWEQNNDDLVVYASRP